MSADGSRYFLYGWIGKSESELFSSILCLRKMFFSCLRAVKCPGRLINTISKYYRTIPSMKEVRRKAHFIPPVKFQVCFNTARPKNKIVKYSKILENQRANDIKDAQQSAELHRCLLLLSHSGDCGLQLSYRKSRHHSESSHVSCMWLADGHERKKLRSRWSKRGASTVLYGGE